MDIYCETCGEPYDVYCVTDKEEKKYMIDEGATIKGHRLIKCPCCPSDTSEIDEKSKERALLSKAAADMLGDDIDGIAATLDDFMYLMDQLNFQQATKSTDNFTTTNKETKHYEEIHHFLDYVSKIL